MRQGKFHVPRGGGFVLCPILLGSLSYGCSRLSHAVSVRRKLATWRQTFPTSTSRSRPAALSRGGGTGRKDSRDRMRRGGTGCETHDDSRSHKPIHLMPIGSPTGGI